VDVADRPGLTKNPRRLIVSEHYDVIIIGTGAGGGTLAYRLAPSGQRILVLERGGYLPREPENWDSKEVFLKGRYLTSERWYDKDGTRFRPHAQYFVGGNTKFYGAILFRFREHDFGEIHHHGGISPAWPISYQDLEPYYRRSTTTSRRPATTLSTSPWGSTSTSRIPREAAACAATASTDSPVSRTGRPTHMCARSDRRSSTRTSRS
jgi:choline dehydrogenase-like flavoprotein